MKMKSVSSRKLIIVPIMLLTFALGILYATQMPNETAHAQLLPKSKMQEKLKEAQSLLAALAVKDFAEIRNSARDLTEISLEAQWSESTSLRYNIFSEDFRYTLDEIAAAADDGNLEGATLYYMQLVRTCIQCHEVVRESESIASLPNKSMFQQLLGAERM